MAYSDAVFRHCPLGQEQSRPQHWSLLRPLSSYIKCQYPRTLNVRRESHAAVQRDRMGESKDVGWSSLCTKDVTSEIPRLRNPTDRFVQPCVRGLLGISDC